MQSTSCKMLGWMNHKLESRWSGEISTASDMLMYHSNVKCEEAVKNLLMTVKEESEKVGLKLNIPKTKGTASGPITSWEIDGKQWKRWEGAHSHCFEGLQNHCRWVADCSHGIERCLLLGRKAMSSVDSIFKSRDVTLLTKVRLVKAMVFPVVMYECERWIIKKAEC